MNSPVKAVLHNGKYVLKTKLGRGTFGTTYLATDTESGKQVVIKTLAANLRLHPNFPQFKQRLGEAIRRFKSCQHPNLVRVLDWVEESQQRPKQPWGKSAVKAKFNRLAVTSDTKTLGCACFIVMEYIPGQTLAEFIQSEQQLPEEQALNYIRQIGNALSTLHQAGLLHGDVKPQNIICRRGTDEVVLTDFGIAHRLTPGMMQTHASLLSAGYAALEQTRFPKKRTPATDIYGLAATLYYLLTGQTPVPASLRNLIPLPNLEEIQPSLSSAVQQAVIRGLEVEANQRPQTVQDWLTLLPDNTVVEEQGSREAEEQGSRGAEEQRGRGAGEQGSRGAGEQGSKGELTDYPLPTTHYLLPTLHSPIQNSKLSSAESSEVESTKTDSPLPTQKNTKKRSKVLIITAAVMASAGAGFGLAIRFNKIIAPGASLLNVEQSFPARGDWPVIDNPAPSPAATSL